MRRLAALILLALTIAWLGPPVAAARAAPSPAYDASGNVVDNGTNLGGFAFTYDFSNQPVAVLGGASGAISNTYVFDANLKRAKYALSTATIYDVYSRVTGSVLYRNNVTNDFRFDLQAIGPLAVTFNRGAPDRFYHSDAQGSRLAFSNSAGVVGARERYTPFGERLIGTTNHHNPGYTGHVRDGDTGLNYMQARLYDPVIGRFLSTDPIGYQDQLNLYAYVANDPVNKTDPTGEFGLAGFAFGAGLDFALQVGAGLASGESFGEAVGGVDYGSVALSGALGAVGQVGGAAGLTAAAKGLSIGTKGKIGEAVAKAGIALKGEKVVATGEKAGRHFNVSGQAARAKPDFVVQGKDGAKKAVEAKFGDAKLTGPQKALEGALGTDKFSTARTSYEAIGNVGGAAGGAAGGVAGAALPPNCSAGEASKSC